MPQDMQPEIEATADIGTPLQALRLHCVECCNGNFAEVRACPNRSCALWLFRLNRNPTAAERAAVAGQPVHPLERPMPGTTALKAVKRRCTDCSGNSQADVRSCTHTGCSLHAFRFGQNPNINRSDAVKAAAAQRLALANASKIASLSKTPLKNPHTASAQVLEGELAAAETPG